MQFGRVRPETEAEDASDTDPSKYDDMCECDGRQEEIDVCCSIDDSPEQPTATSSDSSQAICWNFDSYLLHALNLLTSIGPNPASHHPPARESPEQQSSEQQSPKQHIHCLPASPMNTQIACCTSSTKAPRRVVHCCVKGKRALNRGPGVGAMSRLTDEQSSGRVRKKAHGCCKHCGRRRRPLP